MWFSWDTNPLYSVIHEVIYCQVGGEEAGSRWPTRQGGGQRVSVAVHPCCGLGRGVLPTLLDA